MDRPRKRCAKRTAFRDLSPWRQVLLLVLVALQLGLLAWAEVDIQRRQPNEVRGRKGWWRVLCLINFLGPVSYFRWGRRTGSS